MDKEVIGQKPFEKMRPGTMIKYPSERAGTVIANVARVRLRYQDRIYITNKTDRYIYVIRDL